MTTRMTMQTVHRFRIPALFCALAVLLCELIATLRKMGICDDGPYILDGAQPRHHRPHRLQRMGHRHARLAALPRRSLHQALRLLLYRRPHEHPAVAMALAFVLQRTPVRAGINERNATLGTLALAPLAPLPPALGHLHDRHLRSLRHRHLPLRLPPRPASPNPRAILWICFAVAATPSAAPPARSPGSASSSGSLYPLAAALPTPRPPHRRRRPHLAGALFILACMHWFNHQPYSIPEHFPHRLFRSPSSSEPFFMRYLFVILSSFFPSSP